MGEMMKLKGSALIEAIVASTLFLIVFMLSLDTVTRITTGNRSDEYTLIAADHMADICFARYGDGKHLPGIYEDEFPWGKVTTEMYRYADYEELQEVTVTAEINNSKRKIIRKYIIEVEKQE